MKTPTREALIVGPAEIAEATRYLNEAAAAKKCWHCGCLHSSLRAIEDAFTAPTRPAALSEAIQKARPRLGDLRYDCLGCEVCFPAIAINALGVEGEACPSEPVQVREGWPPLPGAYTVLRYQAPVAICALTDERLRDSIVASAGPEVSLVGNVQTENLGIERLIQNLLGKDGMFQLYLATTNNHRTFRSAALALSERRFPRTSCRASAKPDRPHRHRP